MNDGGNNSFNNNQSGELISWAITIIALIAFWPLGLVLLIRKISAYSRRSSSAGNANNRKTEHDWRDQERYDRHRARDEWHRERDRWKHEARRWGEYYRDQASQYAHGNFNSQSAGQGPSSDSDTAPKAETSSASNEAPRRETAERPEARSGERTDGGQSADDSIKKVKGYETLLTLLGFLFTLIGAVFLSSGLTAGVTGAGLGMSVFGGFVMLGGLISFLMRALWSKKVNRFKNFTAIIGQRDCVSIDELSKALGILPKKARKNLQEMLDSGFFGQTAYIDNGLDSFVRSYDAANREKKAESAEASGASSPGSANQYVAVVNELHMLCAAASDPAICEKISRIEETTVKIFRLVEEHPEKEDLNKRFMSYYLPTTLKLLHSYETLEKQGVSGENIDSAKQEIERVLDILADGFDQQLDRLFRMDKLDISSEINVLENMLKQDGLNTDGTLKSVEDGGTLGTSAGGGV